jgi:sulfite reductase alpha subunit-like flavoprotein
MASIDPAVPVEVADLPGRSMLVLYGSETGNSQDVAEELGRMAQRLHFKTKVEEMNTVSLVRSSSPPHLMSLRR